MYNKAKGKEINLIKWPQQKIKKMKTFEINTEERKVLSYFVIQTQKCFEKLISDNNNVLDFETFINVFKDRKINIENLTMGEVLRNYIIEYNESVGGISDNLIEYSEKMFSSYIDRKGGGLKKGLLVEKIDKDLIDRINKSETVIFKLRRHFKILSDAINLFMYIPVFKKIVTNKNDGLKDNDIVEMYLSNGETYVGYVVLDEDKPNIIWLKNYCKSNRGTLLFDLNDTNNIDIYYRILGKNNFC